MVENIFTIDDKKGVVVFLRLVRKTVKNATSRDEEEVFKFSIFDSLFNTYNFSKVELTEAKDLISEELTVTLELKICYCCGGFSKVVIIGEDYERRCRSCDEVYRGEPLELCHYHYCTNSVMNLGDNYCVKHEEIINDYAWRD